MEREELSINGEWPKLKNKIIERLILQEYWYQGVLDEAVNVVWLKISGTWYRLYFDYGIIFWRTSKEPPSYSKSDFGEEYDYPLNELTEKYNLHDKCIEDCVGSVIEGGSQVKFTFENKQIVTFKNINDSTMIEI